MENDWVARVPVYRSSDLTIVQTVDYSTAGGDPGVDYVPMQGTVTFAVGQGIAMAEVPLINNGRLDGTRYFYLVFENESPGLVLSWSPGGNSVQINDDELEPVADPLFIPDVRPADRFVTTLSDGRILLANEREGLIGGHSLSQELANGLTLLRPDGRVDLWFAPELPDLFRGPIGIRVLEDGHMVVGGRRASSELTELGLLVRIAPNGAVDKGFSPPFSSVNGIDPSGRMLVGFTAPHGDPALERFTTIKRFHADGALDTSFVSTTLPGQATSLAAQRDGKILVLLQGPDPMPNFVRLNSDGTPDGSFTSPWRGEYGIGSFHQRANGKWLVVRHSHTDEPNRVIFQLNDDGSIDSSFKVSALPFPVDWMTLVEKPDGRLIVAGREPATGHGAVVQLAPDGSMEKKVASIRGWGGQCSNSYLTLALTADGQLLLGGNVYSVGGIPCDRLARLRLNPPEREFRIITPPGVSATHGSVRLRVARTGATTHAASISFTTRDDTARAGIDFVATAGTLEFAPMEVNKEVVVPLLARAGATERLWFQLEIASPSEGYKAVTSTPVGIHPELQIATDSLHPAGDGAITATLQSAVPGLYYTLEISTDLKNWGTIAGVRATGSTASFASLHPAQAVTAWFFRVRRH